MRWTLPAGLCIVDVDRVDAHEDNACLDQVRRGVTVEVRRTDGVRGGAEVPIPAGVQQHGCPEARGRRTPPLESPLRGIREPEQLERYVHQRLQIKIGEICSACVSVVRGVQVRTGIPSQSDHVDGKLGALRVVGAGFFPGQVRVDGRHGDARVGNQAGRDGVAEVHQPTARHGAGRGGNATGSLWGSATISTARSSTPLTSAKPRCWMNSSAICSLERSRLGRSSRNPLAVSPPPLTNSTSASKWARYSVMLRQLLNALWVLSSPRRTRDSTASAARPISTSTASRALAGKLLSRKSAGSCRPGGRPTPMRTR